MLAFYHQLNWVDPTLASINSQDRGFLYGDGLFTSIKVVAGKPLLWIYHQQRLTHGATALALIMTPAEFNAQLRLVEQLAAQYQHCIIKVILTRGVGTRGYSSITSHQAAQCYTQVFELSEQLIEPIQPAISAGVLSQTIGQTMPSLSGIKTLNRLEQVLLANELAHNTWAEGLVCDTEGQIIEGVSSNCFMRIKGQWYTPPIENSGIAGTARADLLERMSRNNLPCEVQVVCKTQIPEIDALFFCNAILGIRPVKQLHEHLHSEILHSEILHSETLSCETLNNKSALSNTKHKVKQLDVSWTECFNALFA